MTDPPAEEVAALWGAVLNLKEVPWDATFPELGGNSLLLIAVLAEIDRRFGIYLEAEDVLADLTVNGMARAVVKVRSEN